MPQRVQGYPLLNARPLSRLLNGPLQAGGVYVTAAYLSIAGVHGTPRSGEEILPDELPDRVGVFPLQGIGQVDLAEASAQVFFVEQVHPLYLATQFGGDGFWQGYDALLFTLAVTDGDGNENQTGAAL